MFILFWWPRDYYDKNSHRGSLNDILGKLVSQFQLRKKHPCILIRLWTLDLLYEVWIRNQGFARNGCLIQMEKWNIDLRNGFAKAIQSCLRVKPQGLVSIGLPCCSFVWINKYTSQRNSEKPWGNESKPYIIAHNASLGLKSSQIDRCCGKFILKVIYRSQSRCIC